MKVTAENINRPISFESEEDDCFNNGEKKVIFSMVNG